MAKNTVQFQKGMSLVELLASYGTEEQCRDAVFRWRWPNGFHCPRCNHTGHCVIASRALFQCHRCHQQTSLLSGTLFAGTKLPLRTWFLAIYLITQSKSGRSALALKRDLGVSYNTAWLLKHKIMQAMKERDDGRPLNGIIQLDDAYWGGERHGQGTGRGTAGKTPFVAAVQCNDKGHPIAVRFSRVAGFRREEIARWTRRHLAQGCDVVSDGLGCFWGVTDAGCTLDAEYTGGGAASVKNPSFLWVNTMLGNLKTALHGTYHSFNHKHLPRYLAEFSYRFNRRFDLAELVPRLACIMTRTPPLPYRLVTMAESYG
jgi:transposase-like protein